MARELKEKRPESDASTFSAEIVTTTSRRGRRRDVSPEAASELQARQRVIGLELRRMFDDVTKEPVPAELIELLSQIDQRRAD